jgi:hypothetical protein
MFLTKLKFAAVALLSLGFLGSGVGLLTHGTGQGQPAAVAEESPALLPKKDGKKEPLQKGGKKAEAPVIPIEERARNLRDKLASSVEYDGCEDTKATLAELLDQFARLYNLSFTVDEFAFKVEGVADVLKQEVVKNRSIPRMKTTLHNVLRKVLDRVEGTSMVMYIIRRDEIEITTLSALRSEFGIAEDRPLLPLVWEELENVSLPAALLRMAKASGMNVVLDPRALTTEQAKLTVTCQFDNVPVDTAVRILANMADLQMVRLDNVLYITTPKRASQLQAETKPADNAPRPPQSRRQYGTPG